MNKARPQETPGFSCDQNDLLTPLLLFSHQLPCTLARQEGDHSDSRRFLCAKHQLPQHLKRILLLQVSATGQGRWLLPPWSDRPVGRDMGKTLRT